jgi:hypothetical protein
MKPSNYFFTLGDVVVWPFQSVGLRTKRFKSANGWARQIHFLTVIIIFPA